MKKIWNNINKEHREKLIYSVYNNTFFFYLCDKEWDELIYGVKERLERVANVCDI